MGKRQLPFAGEVVILKINTKWILEGVSIMINKFSEERNVWKRQLMLKVLKLKNFPKH